MAMEMSFKDISIFFYGSHFIKLSRTFCAFLVGTISVKSLSISVSGPDVVKKFPIFSSGGYFDKQSTTCAILMESIMGSSHVEAFQIWTRSGHPSNI